MECLYSRQQKGGCWPFIPLGDDIVGANPLQEAGNVDLLGRPHPAAKLRTKATINILKYPAINLLSS
jgi:hypothetical protein